MEDKSVSLSQKAMDTGDISELTLEQKRSVLDIQASLNLENETALVNFGSSAQSCYEKFSNTALSFMDQGTSMEVERLLISLINKIKQIGIEELKVNETQQGLSSSYSMEQIVERFIKTVSEIDKISVYLKKARIKLLEDEAALEVMYEKNQECIEQLFLYITAGKGKINDAKAKELPVLKENADKGKSIMSRQVLNDFNDRIRLIEATIHNLELTEVLMLQSMAQIRLIQRGNTALIERIKSSLITALPLWKIQFVVAFSLACQNRALELQKAVERGVNGAVELNIQKLRQMTADLESNNSQGAIELEKLKRQNRQLISTINDVLEISKKAASECNVLGKNIEKGPTS